MKLAIIVAAAKNGVIGIKNRLPWHLPQDLKYFKSVTMGKPVIMGRKTYESIGRPLPGRLNIVVTRDQLWKASVDLVVVHSLTSALEAASQHVPAEADVTEAMIIGGAEIYREALPLADKIYLTEVGVEPEGDAFFELPCGDQWDLESITPGEESAVIPHRFLVYQRCTQ